MHSHGVTFTLVLAADMHHAALAVAERDLGQPGRDGEPGFFICEVGGMVMTLFHKILEE